MVHNSGAGMRLWYVIGASEPHTFYKSTVVLVKSTQIALYLSAALLASGVAAAAVNRHLHEFLMVAGLLAFYHAVMYVQLPGFINATPHIYATLALLALFIAAMAASSCYGYAAYAPYAVLHLILYLRGVWGKPTYYPNIITAAGLLLLPFANSHLEAVLTFPLASVYSLMYRIDTSRARRRFTALGALSIAATYVAAFAAVKAGYLWAVVAPSIALTIAAPPRIGDKYGVAALLFRWLVALGPFGTHLVYMAFAVIMSALCVPYFIGAILFRQVPSYGPELVLAASLSYILRNLGILAPSALFVLAIIGYAVIRSMREKYYPPTPP